MIDPREREADRAVEARDFAAAERILARVAADHPARGVVWFKLASARRALGNLPGALEAVSSALRADPLAFMPLLLKASLLDASGEHGEAAELYAAAVFHAPSEDKLPPGMRAQIAHARERHTALIAGREVELGQALAPALAEADAAERKRIARFQSNVLRKTKPWHQAATHFHFPGLPEIEFFDTAQFPGLAALEAEAEAILAEFRALVASEARQVVPYVQYASDVPHQMPGLNHSLDWSALHLIQLGGRIEANARHCPCTLAAYEALDVPAISKRGPNLMFSLLAPHTRIPPHHGVTNTRLVLHLPLIVPPDCGFRVGGETREWVPGKALVFDDTIEHEAWNDSGELRVVLIGDVWRPELTAAERAAASAIIGASEAAAD